MKNNDMIVFVHKKLSHKLKWLMPKKDLLEKHGIGILKMLLVEVFAICDNGFSHRDLHPGNVWISDAFDDLQIMGFYNACSKSRERDIIAFGTPPYFLNRHGVWPPGSIRWDLHAWAVVAAEMIMGV